MAFHEIKTQEEVACNLVPMIDIMFLMLLFFMLNADMSQRELEDVVAPIANQAQEDKPDENTDRITCNVFHSVPDCPLYSANTPCHERGHWAISLTGQHYQLDKAGLEELKRRLTALASARRENPADQNSPSARYMIVRADRLAPYGYVQRSLEQAAGAGLYKIEVACQIQKAEMEKRGK